MTSIFTELVHILFWIYHGVCLSLYFSFQLILVYFNVTPKIKVSRYTFYLLSLFFIFIFFIGKRDNPLGNVVLPDRKLKRENTRDRSEEIYNRKTKRCVPFFCPLFRCPAGKVFEIGPDGCQICRCIKQHAGKYITVKPG